MRELLHSAKLSVVWYAKQLAKVALPLLSALKYAMFMFAFAVGMDYNNTGHQQSIILLVILVVVYLVADFSQYVIRSKGLSCKSIPVPPKRFTEVSDDGIVSVESSRLQEMLVYVADVEDTLERSGRL